MRERLAIVTGAGKGIGRAIAQRLSRDGYRIAAFDLDLASARHTIANITESGGKGQAFACDVSSEAHVIATVAEARSAFGHVNVLANSAGVATNPGLPFTNNTAEDWDLALNINLKPVFFLSKAVAQDMMDARDGRIINISSITGVIHAPYMPPYSVSKAAINSLTKILARDLAPFGVAVNAVCPGYVWTDMWTGLGKTMPAVQSANQDSNSRAVFEQRIRELVPMQREQTAEEIADTVAFLCSHSARNITGQIICVDGGVTIPGVATGHAKPPA